MEKHIATPSTATGKATTSLPAPATLTMSLKIAALLTATIFITTLFPQTLLAVHKGAGPLTCGQCHTMHNSQGNVSLEGDTQGSLLLLRGPVSSRAAIHKLCLQCHASNGAQADVSHAPQSVVAPKVYSPATWTDALPFNLIGAGGNFSTEINTSWDVTTTPALGYGHSLGATNVIPPGGDQPLSYLTCTSCHDPHGASASNTSTVNLFRNLRRVPLDSGATGCTIEMGLPGVNKRYFKYQWTRSYVGSTSTVLGGPSYFGGNELDSAGEVIWPVYRGVLTGDPNSDSANSNSYETGPCQTSARAQRPGMTISQWCAQCHDNWHEFRTTSNKVQWSGFAENGYRDWRRHPVQTTMPRGAFPGCQTGCHDGKPVPIDRTNYTTSLITSGKGLPVTAGGSWGGDSYDPVYYLPNNGSGMDDFTTGHKVFCLTCHFAHAGPYYDALRWDYHTDIAQGQQTGLGLPSTKGCQLCHNR
ncbi:MAG TPA: hypothetical protein ENJ37_10780 [Deltaproteobacteria bacterium]|nr:hypothetical protein [Deltaproteobacteria bacterium]